MNDSASPRFSWPLAVVVVLATGTVLADEKTWTTSNFLDFAGGHFADSGVNTYVSADGSIRLINLWDLNNDGHFDLPVACSQDHDEKVEAFIYWADERGFSPQRRTELPTAGAIGAAAADLNADGHLDIVLANRFDGARTNLDCYIYWGAADGFYTGQRSTLPGKAGKAVAVADLNGDDYPDIVLANQGVDYHMTVDEFQQSFVYWGSASGFSADRRTTLKIINCADVAIADVDRDGHSDIVFANEGNRESESGAVIYLGGGDGDDGAASFSEKRRVDLSGVHCAGVEVVDLNGDGFVEVVLTNMYLLGEKPSPPSGKRVQTYRVNSYIYWGGAEGYSTGRRTELPTMGACGVAAGDLNGDQVPDLVFANSAELESIIYWNSVKGFQPYRRTLIAAPHVHDVAMAQLGLLPPFN